jgi:L-aspartate oxidase
MSWQREADVVVVGSGAAGITTALTAAARGLRVLIVTKDLVGGASPLAQGGLAAAIGPGDSPRSHAWDTEVAGAGLCDRENVAALAAGSPAAIEWLCSRGARLERRDLRLEGGHSVKRVVHSGDDASGAEVHRALVTALLASPIEVLDHAVAVDLVTREDGSATGVTVVAAGASEAGMVLARAVVIAAGGLGQAFATTSNPVGATGDGIALAARAGAVLRDLEFVQFHPTVLWSAGAVGQRPLITEALRGAGAVLRDLDGRPVMAGRHPLADLAPRDIVAAAMHAVISDACSVGTEHAAHLWLDATMLGRDVLEGGFPTVTKACREQGVDPVTDYIPVAPGAHYSCGGIAADLCGRTSIPGLYAAGEAASTGVHGANRLASNSLVEAVIMGRNAGESISSALARPEVQMVDQERMEGGSRAGARAQSSLRARHSAPEHPFGREWDGCAAGAGAVSRAALAAAMSRYAGVVRDREGLTELMRISAGLTLGQGNGQLPPGVAGGENDSGLDVVEAANLRTASVLIAAAALERTESRGCHRRRDAPRTWAQARHTLLRWTPDGLAVSVR